MTSERLACSGSAPVLRAGRMALGAWLLAAALAGGCSGRSGGPDPADAEVDRQVGPYAQCLWDYQNGLEPLRNSATDTAFDTRFDPHITVSRRGLTARVVGVLGEETLARFGGSIDGVIAAYPYLTPVRYLAVHTVRPDDLGRRASWRAANPAGEVIRTEVRELPPHAVMIIYPVSIAAPGYNTAAGNWQILTKMRSRRNSRIGDFGRFPFLSYTYEGHALHGPIGGDPATDMWVLRRGRVSHGCNRMDGEHVVELSVLLGCPATAATGPCASPNEAVVVMEEFDHFPDPAVTSHPTGTITDFGLIATSWVTPEIRDYPRDRTYPLPESLRVALPSGDGRVLAETRNKSWRSSPSGMPGPPTPSAGIVREALFGTWDNRVTSQQPDRRPVVVGRNCELQ